MLVYLSGPMSGLPHSNFPAFHQAAAELRGQGFRVINPAEYGEDATDDDGPLGRAIYLRDDIAYLARTNGIVLLPGWGQSIGANIELFVARVLNLRVYKYEDGATLDAPYLWPDLDLIRRHIVDVSDLQIAHDRGRVPIELGSDV